jgi:hypothetical protein
MRLALAALLVAPLFACSAPDSSLAPASGRVAQSQSAADTSAPGNPATVLTHGRTYWFVFDESPTVLAAVTAKCAKEDAAHADTCVDAVRQEAAKEAIRFSGTDTQHLTWTSFGIDEAGKEELYLEIPFAVTGTEGAFVRVKVAGTPRGRQAAKMNARGDGGLAFEVIDETTIAMSDPDPAKGRLLFRSR